MVKHGVTDEQLDREIEQDDLAPVAMHFDDVELYLNPLKLTDNEQADVRRETYLSRSNQVAVINCLSIWRGHEPSEATFRALIRILLDLRKEKVASKICQHLKDKVLNSLLHSSTVYVLYSKLIFLPDNHTLSELFLKGNLYFNLTRLLNLLFTVVNARLRVKQCINWFVVFSFVQLPIALGSSIELTTKYRIATFYEKIMLFLILERLQWPSTYW